MLQDQFGKRIGSITRLTTWPYGPADDQTAKPKKLRLEKEAADQHGQRVATAKLIIRCTVLGCPGAMVGSAGTAASAGAGSPASGVAGAMVGSAVAGWPC